MVEKYKKKISPVRRRRREGVGGGAQAWKTSSIAGSSNKSRCMEWWLVWENVDGLPGDLFPSPLLQHSCHSFFFCKCSRYCFFPFHFIPRSAKPLPHFVFISKAGWLCAPASYRCSPLTLIFQCATDLSVVKSLVVFTINFKFFLHKIISQEWLALRSPAQYWTDVFVLSTYMRDRESFHFMTTLH